MRAEYVIAHIRYVYKTQAQLFQLLWNSLSITLKFSLPTGITVQQHANYVAPRYPYVTFTAQVWIAQSPVVNIRKNYLVNLSLNNNCTKRWPVILWWLHFPQFTFTSLLLHVPTAISSAVNSPLRAGSFARSQSATVCLSTNLWILLFTLSAWFCDHLKRFYTISLPGCRWTNQLLT